MTRCCSTTVPRAVQYDCAPCRAIQYDCAPCRAVQYDCAPCRAQLLPGEAATELHLRHCVSKTTHYCIMTEQHVRFRRCALSF